MALPLRAIPFIFLLLLSAISRADVTVSVDYGWNSCFRPGHWTPVFITVSSDKPRPILIELYAPHDRSFGMTPHLLATASPRAATYSMLVPMNLAVRDAMVTVTDPQTHRKLADAPFSPDTSPNHYAVDLDNTAGGNMLFLGVAGPHIIPSLKYVHSSNHDAVVGFLDYDRLPSAAIGYDGLSALVLANPNFANLTLDQQSAIVDWVKAGGRLIVLPGGATVPAGSLLESILPATLGDITVLDLASKQLTSLKLSNRFAHLQARHLTPAGDAAELKRLSNPVASAYRHRVGFGQTMLFSFDASQLPLEADAAKRFWQPVIASICPLDDSTSAQNEYSTSTSDTLHNLAVNPLMELLGDVPGVGRFNFSYIAWSLIGLMLLVGPVDWFVLKRLGRQPWTWLTTTGWVALLTLIAISLGQSLRSGELYFRTLTVFDEIDHSAVAQTAMVGLYAPTTANYTLTADPESWWQPLVPNQGYYYGGTDPGRSDLSFTQTYRGNLPDPMRVNIWSLRFIESQSIGSSPGKISASLKLNGFHCTGTITNTGDTPLSQLIIRVHGGSIDLPGTIAAGQTLPVDAQLNTRDLARFNSTNPQGYPYIENDAIKPTLAKTTTLAGNLAGDRTQEINRLVDQDNFACIYALTQPAASSMSLSPTPKFEDHYVVIRSLVSLTAP